MLNLKRRFVMKGIKLDQIRCNRISIMMIAPVIFLALLMVLLLPAEKAFSESKTIQLKFATWSPPGDFIVPHLEWFASEFDKRTGGRTKTTLFLGGALGGTRELPDNVQKGIADMVVMVPTHVPGLMPIAELLSVPMLVPTAAAMDYIGWHLASLGYLKLNGAKILQVTGHEAIVLCMGKKKVSKIEDFKGVVLGTNGTWGPLCSKLGASEVMLPPPELYTSFERGIVDGGALGWGLPKTFQMGSILKYICADSIGNDPWLVVINNKKWNSMSPDIQVALLELSREANHRMRALVSEEEKVCYDLFDKDPNVEVYSYDPGEYEKLKEIARPLTREFAKKLDAKGIPATEALEIIFDDLKALGLNKE